MNLSSIRQVFVSTVLVVCLVTVACAQQKGTELSGVRSVDARNIATLAKKIKKGESLHIGFIGGSITQGAGSTKHSNSYYWKTKNSLKEYAESHGASLEAKLAAVGGTGSDYGSYRLGHQLLDLVDLDLLVVEFAVNDYRNPDALDGMEGIVRQTLKRNPETAIVLFYTVNRPMLAEYYDKGELPASVVAFHKIAQHYGLMEVHLGPEVQSLLASGDETLDSFFRDHSHPLDVGHAYYAEKLSSSIIEALDHAKPDRLNAGLPSVLGTGDYEYASLKPIVPVEKSGVWEEQKRGYYTYFGSWKSTEAGASMTFEAGGKKIVLLCNKLTKMHVVGPGFEETLSSRGRRNGIPIMKTIYEGETPISGRITVSVEPNSKGEVEASISGMAVIDPK